MSDNRFFGNNCNASYFKKWADTIKEKLNFSSVKIGIPAGQDEELFDGSMYIEEPIGDVFKTIITSSAITESLTHKDSFSSGWNKLFIVYSCGDLIIQNQNHREFINPGDALLLPSCEKFDITSFSKRQTVSIIMDVNNILGDTNYTLEDISWIKTSKLTYGDEINRLLLNYHTNHGDRFALKNTKALMSLLSLEFESCGKLCFENFYLNKNISMIFDFIKKNIKNSDLCLSTVADYFKISERMVQYTLSAYGVTFCDFVASERCQLLAKKIISNPYVMVDVYIYESGFNSIATANRQFKKRFNETPRKFQEKQKNNLHVHHV
ncbi:helix-turn-helix domain-containing protein [Salmonella enterica subsp. enterica serovar Nigeria]|nr:helix-turn-helix domain-containing protein [Salmonella enterica subsp. enterica serovar Nigeria]